MMSTGYDSEREYGSKQYYERVTRDMTKFQEVLNNTRWKLPDAEPPVFSKPTLANRISGILSWVSSPRVEFKVLDLVILLVLVGLCLGIGNMRTDFGQGLLLGAVVLFMSFAIVKPLISRFLDMLFAVMYREREGNKLKLQNTSNSIFGLLLKGMETFIIAICVSWMVGILIIGVYKLISILN